MGRSHADSQARPQVRQPPPARDRNESTSRKTLVLTNDTPANAGVLQLQRAVGNRAVSKMVVARQPPNDGGDRIEPEKKPDMAYAHRFASAVGAAFSAWKSVARIVGARVYGPTAIGGRLVGPSMVGLILALAPQGNARETAMSSRLAAAIGGRFNAARASFSIPGLPFYPAFAAFPGPVAPPMPNVPFPLVTCMRPPATPAVSGPPDMAMTLPIAAQLGMTRLIGQFFGTTIMNVLGKGPIPSFAPPYVPVGPVVNGTTIPSGGVLY